MSKIDLTRAPKILQKEVDKEPFFKAKESAPKEAIAKVDSPQVKDGFESKKKNAFFGGGNFFVPQNNSQAFIKPQTPVHAQLVGHLFTNKSANVSKPADAQNYAMLRASFKEQTQAFATKDPATFDVVAQQAFGDKGGALLEAAQKGELSEPQNIRFVDRSVLKGSDGAYSPHEGGTVYLADDLKQDPTRLKATYAHEAAHHLDEVLGGGDAKGDEGHIFAQGLTTQKPMSAAELTKARQSNDVSTIEVDGQSLEVENRWGPMDIFNLATSAASWIPGVGDAVSLGSAAVNAATGNYAAAILDVISIVPGVGDAIGSAGKLLLQNRLGYKMAGNLAEGLLKHGPELKRGVQNALNAAKRKGIISPAQHRNLSNTLDQQLGDLTRKAQHAADPIQDGVQRSGEVVETLMRPSSQTTISRYNGKHVPRRGMTNSQIAESTKRGPAKFFGDVDMNAIQNKAWQSGTPVTNGKPWKVFDAGKDIGAKSGQTTRYMRIESTPDGVIHGHPITLDEFRRLTRN